MGFTIDIEGDLNRRIDEMTEEVKRVVKGEMDAFGQEARDMAQNLCPVDKGPLRENIFAFPLPAPDIGIEFVVPVAYAAYVEFGTGVFAAAYVSILPVEIQEYARTFFINGRGRMPAQPFLFPAIEKARVNLINRLNAQIG